MTAYTLLVQAVALVGCVDGRWSATRRADCPRAYAWWLAGRGLVDARSLTRLRDERTMRVRLEATSRNLKAEGRPVQLRFLGKETTGGQSPTLYATDQDSYVVQGWIVSDPDVLARIDVAEDETVVEVYSRLLAHLEKDGLSGEVVSDRYPIVSVTESGNCILQGKQLIDEDAVAQMNIPDHETAIEVPRNAMAKLVEGR